MKTQKNRKFKRGQGMTEYIIIVALIAIAAVGVVTLFGDNIRRLFGMSADVLSGEVDARDSRIQSNTDIENKALDNFGQGHAVH